jgi:hypothetical protein
LVQGTWSIGSAFVNRAALWGQLDNGLDSAVECRGAAHSTGTFYSAISGAIEKLGQAALPTPSESAFAGVSRYVTEK